MPNATFETEDDSENEEQQIPLYTGGKKENSLDNAKELPLFADFDGRTLKTAVKLKLFKLDLPGIGYKGEIPLTSTLETIAQMCGNGLYNVLAFNERGKCLARNENLKISLAVPEEEHKNIPEKKSESVSDVFIELVKANRSEHKEELNRVQDLATQTSKQVIEQGRQYVEMVTKTVDGAANREREHMKGVNQQQQDFFSNMLQSQNQMFQQMFLLMQTSHTQTVQLMQAAHDRENNNPMALVEVLMKGLAMGREMESGDDSPDWLKGLEKGGDMISNLVAMSKLSPKVQHRPVVKKGLPVPSTPQSKNVPQNDLSEEEIKDLLKLKKLLRDRGSDLRTAVVSGIAELEAEPTESKNAVPPINIELPNPQNDVGNQEDTDRKG